MAISPCVCYCCIATWPRDRVPSIQDANDKARSLLYKDLWVSIIFNKLETANLHVAAQVCTQWRWSAAKHYKLDANTLRGAGCFKPLITDFEASRHVIFMDVSSSMNEGGSKDNAMLIFKEITGQIGSAVAVNGLYICKFAKESAIHHFDNAVKAEKFLHEQTKLADGTKLSTAVDAVYDKILKRENKKDTHFYIISDMLMQHDNTLNDKVFNAQKLSALNKKVTFHYYPAKTVENPVLKETGKQFELIKDTTVPGIKKKISDCVDVKFYALHTKKQIIPEIIVPEVVLLD